MAQTQVQPGDRGIGWYVIFPFLEAGVLDLFIMITFSGKGAVKHFAVRQFITLLLFFSLHHVLCII